MQILKLSSSPEGGSISPFKTKDRTSPDLGSPHAQNQTTWSSQGFHPSRSTKPQGLEQDLVTIT